MEIKISRSGLTFTTVNSAIVIALALLDILGPHGFSGLGSEAILWMEMPATLIITPLSDFIYATFKLHQYIRIPILALIFGGLQWYIIGWLISKFEQVLFNRNISLSARAVKIATRIVGVFILGCSLTTLMGVSISGYIEPDKSAEALKRTLSWSFPLLFISGVGILFFKKWAWYLAIISYVLCLVFLVINYTDNMYQMFGIQFPFMLCVIYLLLPKVEEQFK